MHKRTKLVIDKNSLLRLEFDLEETQEARLTSKKRRKEMIVPLKLHTLALKKGGLTPHFALGWRIGTYVQEHFDSLQHLRIATNRDDDTTAAIHLMINESGNPSPSTIYDEALPFDFLFFSPAKERIMSIRLAPKFDPEALNIEEEDLDPARSGAPSSGILSDINIKISKFRKEMDGLVGAIAVDPPETLFLAVDEKVVRVDEADAGECESCGNRHGVFLKVGAHVLCLNCSPLAKQWFMYN